MVKFLRYATMVMALSCVVGLILLGISCINAHGVLAASAETVGEDYVAFGVVYASGILITSVLGIALGALCKRYSEQKWLDILCACVVGICCIGVLVAAYLWFSFGFV